MREELLGHEAIRFDGGGYVLFVNTDGDTHQHVLGALNHFPVNLQ